MMVLTIMIKNVDDKDDEDDDDYHHHHHHHHHNCNCNTDNNDKGEDEDSANDNNYAQSKRHHYTGTSELSVKTFNVNRSHTNNYNDILKWLIYCPR
ncbi:hypothetical protein PoB_002225300 [Plakobranchus ocellatus]|uniref:Uncharacterized protein n=1 Tax=Plakobranchus ocellatus TaxID=259542 RepID=A0AAV3ZLM6_9GAST|nr:hypothetical protein PoB_002225300 [Plakobranchus ocellatus]